MDHRLRVNIHSHKKTKKEKNPFFSNCRQRTCTFIKLDIVDEDKNPHQTTHPCIKTPQTSFPLSNTKPTPSSSSFLTPLLIYLLDNQQWPPSSPYHLSFYPYRYPYPKPPPYSPFKTEFSKPNFQNHFNQAPSKAPSHKPDYDKISHLSKKKRRRRSRSRRRRRKRKEGEEKEKNKDDGTKRSFRFFFQSIFWLSPLTDHLFQIMLYPFDWIFD